jgi:serine/threonine-protein kinase
VSGKAEIDALVGRLVLDRYRIVRVLAKGGQGVIYLARSEGAAGFVKPVVVKRILPHLGGDSEMARMFVREARIMSQLRHPSILSIADFAEEDDGGYVMVLDYVHGHPMSRWLRYLRETNAEMPVEIAIHAVTRVLDALAYAHALRGADGEPLHIVHRDVTPANVLVDVEGHVVLADFGIAQTRLDATSPKGGIVTVRGNFPYLAPELYRGSEPSPATDVYSAAVTLHELLTGRNELAGGDPNETMARVLGRVPRRVDALRRDAPAELADILDKALAKEPGARFASGTELADALRAVRLVTSDRAQEMLEQRVARDFHDPRFATVTATPPLADLEQAWRSGVPVRSEPPMAAAGAQPKPRSSLPTQPAAAIADVGPARDRGAPGRAWAIGAIGAAVLAAGAVAYVAIGSDPAPAGPRYVIVDGTASRDAGATAARDAGAATADAGTLADTAEGIEGAPPVGAGTADAGGARTSGNGRPSSPVAALSRAFARNQARISRCFESGAVDVSGVPQISVRFEIDAAGAVTAATLEPPALGGTALGTCILDVARATRFPPQPEPVAFRIPITARAR